MVNTSTSAGSSDDKSSSETLNTLGGFAQLQDVNPVGSVRRYFGLGTISILLCVGQGLWLGCGYVAFLLWALFFSDMPEAEHPSTGAGLIVFLLIFLPTVVSIPVGLIAAVRSVSSLQRVLGAMGSAFGAGILIYLRIFHR